MCKTPIETLGFEHSFQGNVGMLKPIIEFFSHDVSFQITFTTLFLKLSACIEIQSNNLAILFYFILSLSENHQSV